ncbi:MAG: histidine phosphatase family protein [Anaerolineales bacterium]|nr:histidine phosphatase family protein [Anaerolineales bacterium]
MAQAPINQSPIFLMPTHLILVRHTAVFIDPSVSSHDWVLTEDGRSATHTLAHKLIPYQPSRLITSEEPKAIATGAALAEVLALPTHAAPGLQEHDRRGVPYFENKAEFETAVAHFFTHPHDLVFGNETAVQARMRFGTAVQQQQETYPQDTLALVTHGTVLTLFLCHHNPQLDPVQFWQSLTLPCAFVVRLPGMQLVTAV